MKQLLDIAFEWRYVIIVAIAFILWCAFDWANVKVQIYQWMLLAKSKAKDMILKSGQEQEDFVVEHVWAILPLKFKIFLTEDRLRKIIKWLYKQAKDKLDDGKLNNSI